VSVTVADSPSQPSVRVTATAERSPEHPGRPRDRGDPIRADLVSSEVPGVTDVALLGALAICGPRLRRPAKVLGALRRLHYGLVEFRDRVHGPDPGRAGRELGSPNRRHDGAEAGDPDDRAGTRWRRRCASPRNWPPQHRRPLSAVSVPFVSPVDQRCPLRRSRWTWRPPPAFACCSRVAVRLRRCTPESSPGHVGSRLGLGGGRPHGACRVVARRGCGPASRRSGHPIGQVSGSG